MSQNKILLDAKQKEAVEYDWRKPLLVSAGPGSGKTRVVAERVKHLILDEHVDADKILCITFTNAGADEMIDRLCNDQDLEKSDRKKLKFQIRTIHSLCFKMINGDRNQLFKIKNNNDNDHEYNYDRDDQIDIKEWIRVLKAGKLDGFHFDKLVVDDKIIDKLVDGVSAFKREDHSADDLRTYLEKPRNDATKKEYLEKLDDLLKYFEAYEDYKYKVCLCGHSPKNHRVANQRAVAIGYAKEYRQCNGVISKKFVAEKCPCEKYRRGYKIDFDDQLRKAMHDHDNGPYPLYLDNFYNPKARHKATIIEHLIVDEFQDNNYLEFEIATRLAPEGHITVVGDINQSIFSFQGAKQQIFSDFETKYGGCKRIRLENNYRSTPQIIKLSDRLLEKDPDQKKIEKQKTDNDSGEKIKIYEFCDPGKENDFFVKLILSKIDQEFFRRGEKKSSKIKFSDFVILARTNSIRKKIRDFLVYKGIPCRSKSYRTLQEEETLHKAAARIFPDKEYKQLTPAEKDNVKNSMKPGRYSKKLKEIVNDYKLYEKPWTDKNNLHNTPNKEYKQATLATLIKIFEIKKTEKNSEEDEVVYKVLHNLARNFRIKKLDEWKKLKVNATNKTIKEFESHIQNFYGFTDSDAQPDPYEGDTVEIGTAHSVKGEEYPFVIVSNSHEWHFPLEYKPRELTVPYDISDLVQQPRIIKCPNCETVLDHSKRVISCPKCKYDDIEICIHYKEERRLYYVAMTRAMHELFLTFSVEEETIDGKMKYDPSDFLVDLEYRSDKTNIDYKDKDTPKITPTAVVAAPTPPAPLPVLTAYRLACSRCYHKLVKPTSVNSTQTCTNCGWYS